MQEVLKNNKAVICDFWADYCPPCRALKPGVIKLAEQNTNPDLVFALIDCQNSGDACDEYSFRGIPHCKGFLDGKEVFAFSPGSNVGRFQQGVEQLEGMLPPRQELKMEESKPEPAKVKEPSQEKKGPKYFGKVKNVLDQDTMEKVIEKYPGVIVNFCGPMCIPCEDFKPIFKNKAEETFEENKKIKFCQVNVVDNPETASHYGIEDVPQCRFFFSEKPMHKLDFEGNDEAALTKGLRKFEVLTEDFDDPADVTEPEDEKPEEEQPGTEAPKVKKFVKRIRDHDHLEKVLEKYPGVILRTQISQSYEAFDDEKLEEYAKNLESKCVKICFVDISMLFDFEGPWTDNSH